MTPVLQMPYREQAAAEIGPRLFRKQILRTGEIPYKGERLKFDRAYLAKAVESFNAGAYDQVPFVLADDDNKHAVGPERFHGEVKALEMNGDGIDALVELTEEGAEIVRKNPRLGVSARLVPDREVNGQVFPVAIEHVCGTLNPRVNGLRPWETDSVRSLTQDSDTAVIDLSASEYMDSTATLTDDQLETLKGLSPEERTAKAQELLSPKAEPTDEGKGILNRLKKMLDGHDAELEGSFENLKDDATDAEKGDKETDKVTASLSADDQKRIDLAEETARKADSRVAAAEWKAERTELTNAGVPPAMLDLAEPLLKSGQKVVIDLSDDSKADASEVIRKLLDQAKGTVDLSEAKGSDKDADERTEAKDLASDDNWKASI